MQIISGSDWVSVPIDQPIRELTLRVESTRESQFSSTASQSTATSDSRPAEVVIEGLSGQMIVFLTGIKRSLGRDGHHP
jgi:hypothetical protein